MTADIRRVGVGMCACDCAFIICVVDSLWNSATLYHVGMLMCVCE